MYSLLLLLLFAEMGVRSMNGLFCQPSSWMLKKLGTSSNLFIHGIAVHESHNFFLVDSNSKDGK